MILGQESANIFWRGQLVNISTFLGHIVSIVITQLCCCNMTAVRDKMQINENGCVPINFPLWPLTFKFSIIFMHYKILFFWFFFLFIIKNVKKYSLFTDCTKTGCGWICPKVVPYSCKIPVLGAQVLPDLILFPVVILDLGKYSEDNLIQGTNFSWLVATSSMKRRWSVSLVVILPVCSRNNLLDIFFFSDFWVADTKHE